jgi:uncharacterized protein with beta-barrel porin domain
MKIEYNATQNYGGGIKIEDSSMTIIGGNQRVEIKNNTAQKGGGIYISNGKLILESGEGMIEIADNQAQNGSGIYMINSTMTMIASRGNIEFKNENEDIYLDEKSEIIMNMDANKKITFFKNIMSNEDAKGIKIEKNGLGNLELKGYNEIWGDVNIKEGFLVLSPSIEGNKRETIYRGKTIKIEENDSFFYNGGLDLRDGKMEKIEVEEFINNNKSAQIRMDIRAGTSEEDNDQIYAQRVEIRGGRLIVRAGVGEYNSREYEMIISSKTAVDGKFSALWLEDENEKIDATIISSELNYADENKVKLKISAKIKSNLEAAAESFNQKEAGRLVDKMSRKLDPNIKEQNEMIGLITEVAYGSDENARRFLGDGVSGYFISNLIRSAMLNGIKEWEIYERMGKKKIDGGNFWVKVIGENKSYDADENSLWQYKEESVGGAIGIDGNFGENFYSGLYSQYVKTNAKQEESRGEINSIGGGAYLGFVGNWIEIKSLVSISRDKYESKRKINYESPFLKEEMTEGNFEGLKVGADVEIGIRGKIGNLGIIKPYAGCNVKALSNKTFREKSENLLDLEVKDGIHERVETRAGISWEYENKSVKIKIAGEGAKTERGSFTEIESSLYRIDDAQTEKMKTRSYEEEKIRYSIKSALTIILSQRLSLSANLSVSPERIDRDTAASAAINYKFAIE